MARTGLLYNAAGDVIGHVTCSQDEDLERQTFPLVEVPNDHAARVDPKGWRVVLGEDRPVVQRKAPSNDGGTL